MTERVTVITISYYGFANKTETITLDAGVGEVTIDYNGPDYGTLIVKGPQVCLRYDHVSKFTLRYMDK